MISRQLATTEIDQMPKKKTDPSLSDVIISKMRSCGKTQYRIAKESGVDSSTLGRFVKGERTITLEVANKICKALGLQLTDVTLDE
jgi:transcriptional regulator with XRE-family HTH domain